MARRRRSALALRQKLGGAVRLGLVLAILVGVNVYVFFYSPGSLKSVSQAAQAASLHGADDHGLATTSAPAAEATGTGTAPPPPAGTAGPAPATPRAKPRKHDGTLKEREGLGVLLRREGLAPADADGVLRALAAVMSFRKEIHGGLGYTVRLDATGRLDEFELRAAPGVIYRVTRGPEGKLGAERLASTPRLVHH